jgi:hypothetical protein
VNILVVMLNVRIFLQGLIMELSKIEIWVILMNLTGFLLWGMTIVYLVRKEAKKGEGSFRNPMKLSNDNLGNECFSQILMKQSDVAFKRISDSIIKERELLCNLFKSGSEDKEPISDNLEYYKAKEFVIPSPVISCEIETDKPVPSIVYSEAVRLAELGMDTDKISQKLMLPRGEVELLIKLRKKPVKVNKNSSDRMRLANKSFSTSI